MGAQEQRRLGLVTATLLVVASMIGTGVFTTSGFLIADLRSAPAVLAAWLAGGLLALCGALVYAELVAALPRNGGEYQLLGRIYHPAVGFAAGWISFIVGFSAPIAASALAFGSYLAALVPGIPPSLAALALIALLSLLHGLHVRAGGGVQNVFTVLKVALIAILIAGGLARGDLARLGGGEQPLLAAAFSPAFAVGLIFISFSYSGWNGAAYLAGEVRRPGRFLPLALVAGTSLVIALFVALNLVFLAAAPAAELAGQVAVGHVAAVHLFGAAAGRLLSALIALALVSSVSAMIMAGPRVYAAMGADHHRLRLLSRRTRHGGPASAVALQALVAAAMVLSASFDELLTFIGFTLSLCTALSAAGVFVLRWREPDLPRPYRAWGHPLSTLLFLALSAWMIAHAILEKPVIAGAGAAVVASGLALYLLVRRPARIG